MTQATAGPAHPLLDTRRCSLAEVEGIIPKSLSYNPGSYLFWALDQCIQEAAHIVNTSIWDVSMAEGHRHNESIRGYAHLKWLP